MHNEDFFFQAFVYLVAAVLSCRSPNDWDSVQCWAIWLQGGHWSVCRLCRTQGDDVMHFAEFGVVMLFLVGLELQPSLLWRLRPDSGTRRLAGGGYDPGRRHHQFHLWAFLANGSGGWHDPLIVFNGDRAPNSQRGG